MPRELIDDPTLNNSPIQFKDFKNRLSKRNFTSTCNKCDDS